MQQNIINSIEQGIAKAYNMLGGRVSMCNDTNSVLYYNIFGHFNTHLLVTDKEKFINKLPYLNEYYIVDEHNKKEKITWQNNIDTEKTDINLMKYDLYRFCIDYTNIYIDWQNRIMIMPGQSSMTMLYIEATDDIINKYKGCIEYEENENGVAEVGILTTLGSGYYVSYEEFDKMNIDPEKIYNDDIPLEKMHKFVDDPGAGLALFYGEPGTGKTTFIKYLIETHSDTDFIILDSNILGNISSQSLINTMLDNKDAIYILEDCEKLLMNRDDYNNPIISTFLNLSDGILGTVLNSKFICTFNTDLSRIDDALKRKGRMKVKYEFGKLNKKKVHAINEKCNEDMTIADLFNYEAENDFSKKQSKKIGF